MFLILLTLSIPATNHRYSTLLSLLIVSIHTTHKSVDLELANQYFTYSDIFKTIFRILARANSLAVTDFSGRITVKRGVTCPKQPVKKPLNWILEVV